MVESPGQADIFIGADAIEAAAAMIHEWEKSSEYDARPLVRRVLALVLGNRVEFGS